MHSRNILIALILGCTLVAPAYARPGDLRGFGAIQRKDMGAGTLTIDGFVYAVTAETQLRDSQGHATTLAAIEAPQRREEGSDERLPVFYTAVETSDGLHLTSLEVMHEFPQ